MTAVFSDILKVDDKSTLAIGNDITATAPKVGIDSLKSAIKDVGENDVKGILGNANGDNNINTKGTKEIFRFAAKLSSVFG